MEYRGAQADDWIRGSFISRDYKNPKQLDITAQEPTQVSNKTVLVIYILKGKKLTVAAGDMGSDQRPANFISGQHVDVFNFTRD